MKALDSKSSVRGTVPGVRIPPSPPNLFSFSSKELDCSHEAVRKHRRHPAELVRVAKQFGFEGIIAKRADSLYESGERSGAWLNYRINRGQELVIGGYVPNNPIDSIIIGYYQNGTLLYAAKVRNGFVPHTRRAVAAKLRGREIATCPFANLPERKRTQWALTKEEMKNCKWVKPEVVAQIEFAEWTPDAHLRHASFVGLRDDKDPREVMREVER